MLSRLKVLKDSGCSTLAHHPSTGIPECKSALNLVVIFTKQASQSSMSNPLQLICFSDNTTLPGE